MSAALERSACQLFFWAAAVPGSIFDHIDLPVSDALQANQGVQVLQAFAGAYLLIRMARSTCTAPAQPEPVLKCAWGTGFMFSK